MIRNKIAGSILGGALALGLLGGGMFAYAQTDPATPTAPSTEPTPALPATGTLSRQRVRETPKRHRLGLGVY